jgi:hypothetical protein
MVMVSSGIRSLLSGWPGRDQRLQFGQDFFHLGHLGAAFGLQRLEFGRDRLVDQRDPEGLDWASRSPALASISLALAFFRRSISRLCRSSCSVSRATRRSSWETGGHPGAA